MPIPEIKLTAEDKAKLEGLQEDIVALRREITKAERAGLDLGTTKKDFEKAVALREGLLREYG